MEEAFKRELVIEDDLESDENTEAFWRIAPCNRGEMYSMIMKILMSNQLTVASSLKW
jgi:hypothetical protein